VHLIKILNVKVINNILSVHEFIIISVISVEIIVITLSFDLILKSSLISLRIQYIINLSFILIIYYN